MNDSAPACGALLSGIASSALSVALSVSFACCAFLCSQAYAQAPPRVSFTGDVTDVSSAQVQLVFVVALPAGYHVNSDAPLDEFLRPTQLMLELPSGASVADIRYPEASMFKTRFSPTPLSVYEHRFEIGAVLTLDGPVADGALINATLKYQACSDRICYPPTTRSTQVSLAANLSDN